MSSIEKVAIVTGANKGIGFGVVRGLCQKFDGIVYLTSRDIRRGDEAVAKLKAENLTPAYHQLDVTNAKSIEEFRDYILQKHGGIDLLINNAARAFYIGSEGIPFAEQARLAIELNYFGTLKACEILFPLLRPNARVVNVSSSLGHFSVIPSEELRKKFNDPKLTIPGLSALMNEFVKSAEEGTNEENGWGQNAYSVSKVGVSALTLVQQRTFEETDSRNIQVNAVHPGSVRTDMSGGTGHFDLERGSRAVLYLALDAHNLYGKYIWHDSTIVDLDSPSLPPRF